MFELHLHLNGFIQLRGLNLGFLDVRFWLRFFMVKGLYIYYGSLGT